MLTPSVTDAEKLRFPDPCWNPTRSALALRSLDLGRTNVVQHKTLLNSHTGNSRPVKQPLRHASSCPSRRNRPTGKEMLEQDVIEKSSSPWDINVVVVKKKDGTIRFCIDYRKLNDAFIKDSYPLPVVQITDCLDVALSEGRFFSAFDLRSGYFQVMMDEKDKEKTSFVTRSGLYQFKVLPYSEEPMVRRRSAKVNGMTSP